jgi:hypothetical protein
VYKVAFCKTNRYAFDKLYIVHNVDLIILDNLQQLQFEPAKNLTKYLSILAYGVNLEASDIVSADEKNGYWP